MEEGRSRSQGPQRSFYEAVKEAEAAGEVHAVAVLRKAAKDDWRAALALLERRHVRALAPAASAPSTRSRTSGRAST